MLFPEYFFYDHICEIGYKEQVDEILNEYSCDVEPRFLGFMKEYFYLSKIIPEDRVIYDLGCGYGFQAAFFENHKNYIGIDIGTQMTLFTKNSSYLMGSSIEKFCENVSIRDPHFAIMNYVPDMSGKIKTKVKEKFKDLFIFYPQEKFHSERIVLKALGL